ncbi:MAG: DUF6883 domain-containing protein [Acidobacteriota bacterium]
MTRGGFADLRDVSGWAATRPASSSPPSATTAPAVRGLLEQIRRAILRHEAIFLRRDRYGRHYRVDLTLEGPRGTGRVRTGWLYDRGSDVPRLTTAYVLRSTTPAER